MYHDLYVHDKSESGFQTVGSMPYKVKSEVFERHVKAVKEYTNSHKNTEVEFSFDDGGVTFLTLAAPILEKYGMRGTFFITTKYIDTEGFLSSKQLKELAQRGHLVGAHSHTHALLNTLSHKDLIDEWRISTEIIKDKIGHCDVASIPNGASSDLVLREAQKAGIKILYTSEPSTKEKFFNKMRLIGRYTVVDGMDENAVMRIITDSNYRRKMYIKRLFLKTARKLMGSAYFKVRTMILKAKQK